MLKREKGQEVKSENSNGTGTLKEEKRRESLMLKFFSD